MKKIIGLIGIIVWAQMGFSQQHFGIKAGLNMAWQRQHYAFSVYPNGWKPDIRTLAGYEAGFFYHTPLAEHWILSAEANFSSRGSKTQDAVYVDGQLYVNGQLYAIGPKQYTTTRLFYLDIPLFIQYKVHRFKVGAGLNAGLLIKSRTSFRDLDLPGKYRTFDAGIGLLAGYQLARRWEVDLRYYHGLTDTYPVDAATARNRFANFSLLYTLK